MAKKTTTTKEKSKSAALRPAKILVTTDFSENARQAFCYANTYAKEFGAAVYLLHVLEPPPFMSDLQDVPLMLSDKQIEQKTKDELEGLAAQEFDPSVRVEKLVRKGKAYQEIVTVAKELNIDLIVIDTHGYTGLKHTLMGSTAERVVRHAPCPVLVVRQGECSCEK